MSEDAVATTTRVATGVATRSATIAAIEADSRTATVAALAPAATSNLNVNKALAASLILKVTIQSREAVGHAVAISSKRALSALHGLVKIDEKVKVITNRGVTLTGRVEFAEYTETLVDIAVIILDENIYFEDFLPWTPRPVNLTQPLVVIGLRAESNSDNFSPCGLTTSVFFISRRLGSSFFLSSYYSFDDCFRPGIVTATINGIISVVGVHIASHKDSRFINAIKMSNKRTRSDLEVNITSDIHGRGNYCVICEVARVPDLVSLLKQHLENSSLQSLPFLQ